MTGLNGLADGGVDLADTAEDLSGDHGTGLGLDQAGGVSKNRGGSRAKNFDRKRKALGDGSGMSRGGVRSATAGKSGNDCGSNEIAHGVSPLADHWSSAAPGLREPRAAARFN